MSQRTVTTQFGSSAKRLITWKPRPRQPFGSTTKPLPWFAVRAHPTTQSRSFFDGTAAPKSVWAEARANAPPPILMKFLLLSAFAVVMVLFLS